MRSNVRKVINFNISHIFKLMGTWESEESILHLTVCLQNLSLRGKALEDTQSLESAIISIQEREVRLEYP